MQAGYQSRDLDAQLGYFWCFVPRLASTFGPIETNEKKNWATFGKFLQRLWLKLFGNPGQKLLTSVIKDAWFVTTDTKMGKNDCFEHFCQLSIFPYDEESYFTLLTFIEKSWLKEIH